MTGPEIAITTGGGVSNHSCSALSYSTPTQSCGVAILYALCKDGPMGSQPRECLTGLVSVQMLLKCADIGHLAADVSTHKRWAYQLEEEFFRQVSNPSLPACLQSTWHASYDVLVLCLLVCMLSLPNCAEACASLLASIHVERQLAWLAGGQGEGLWLDSQPTDGQGACWRNDQISGEAGVSCCKLFKPCIKTCTPSCAFPHVRDFKRSSILTCNNQL